VTTPSPYAGSGAPPPLNVAIELRGERLVIRIADYIDTATAASLFTRLHTLILTTRAAHVVIDLGGLDFCDAAGARALIRLCRTAPDHGVTCRLHHPRPHIRWLLRNFGAEHLIDI